jgi:hypothetical protein
MAITTTDVVTNVVSGVEVPKNATCVVFCQRTGEFETLNATFETSIGYNELESKYTNRFDNINYYTLGNSTIVGG